jgi:hypothetical protein
MFLSAAATDPIQDTVSAAVLHGPAYSRWRRVPDREASPIGFKVCVYAVSIGAVRVVLPLSRRGSDITAL